MIQWFIAGYRRITSTGRKEEEEGFGGGLWAELLRTVKE